MLNLNSVMIGTTQPLVLAAFYEKVLGKSSQDMADQEHGFWGWQVGGGLCSRIRTHSAMHGSRPRNQARVMINFETSQVKEEFERIKSLWRHSHQRAV